ncbi:beta-N-acetylhexosaminidase, partial [Methylobacterium radiotolerans]
AAAHRAGRRHRRRRRPRRLLHQGRLPRDRGVRGAAPGGRRRLGAAPRRPIAAPRGFARRGVMLDVARHFFGVDDVKRFIDSTSALKFNHLHLHLTDDQGWRVHIDSWPLLTERAAATAADGAPGGYYTKDDYREIVAYA